MRLGAKQLIMAHIPWPLHPLILYAQPDLRRLADYCKHRMAALIRAFLKIRAILGHRIRHMGKTNDSICSGCC